VVALSLAIAVAAENVQKHIPGLQKAGGTIGASISGTFLLAIAVLDFIILLGIIDVWKKTKSGQYEQQELDDLMMQRGFINRIMGSRWRRFISDSWQMYPVGILFGLGFDTASEVGLLALTGAAATGHTGGAGPAHHLPFMAILALPLLFTAGMSMMDTTDGVVMAKAYGWAFKNPLRKVWYNMSTVTLGIFVAVGVGLVEYLQVFSDHAGLSGGFWNWLNGLDFEILGYFIIGAFVFLWIASVVYYRVAGIEKKYGHRLSVDPFAMTVPDSRSGCE
jgi:high-affinity nickel-transport protein